MTTIKQADLIQSIADALQFISYYHPLDYIQAVGRAYEREQSPAAKDALAQILTNSRMCAEGHRPICQDTGVVVVFVKVGMDVRFEGDMALNDMINEGVRRAYLHPDNKLRASILADAVEAIIAADYLDGGAQAAKDLILRLFGQQLAAVDPLRPLKDPKTRLQEFLQARHLGLPEYGIVSVGGSQHRQTFEVLCRIEQLSQQTRGQGGSRRKAEQAAALAMLEQLSASEQNS